MKPLVSVIMPVYNREEFLAESLDSLLNQSYTNWECIIVDDGSTDATELVAKSFLKKDKRFQFHKRPKHLTKGAASCRNYALSKCKGEFIQYLDSDDLISPNKLLEQLKELKGLDRHIATCSWKIFKDQVDDWDSVNEDLEYLDSGIYNPQELFQFMGRKNTYLPVHSYLTPYQLIKAARNWNENLSNNDDAEFFARVLTLTEKVHVRDNVWAYYRKSGTNNLSTYSSKEKLESVIKSWKLIEKHLHIAYGKEVEVYIENSKQRLFRNVSWENPELIEEFPDFFRKYQRQQKKAHRLNILRRISRRLKSRLGL